MGHVQVQGGVGYIDLTTATTTASGLMSAADKAKLDGLGTATTPKLEPAVWSQQHNPTLFSGNDTVGIYFYAIANATITGMKVYWGGPATTLRARLWTNANTTSVATATLAVSGSGLYTISFASPFAASAWTLYAASVYDTSGTNYTATNNTPATDFTNLWPGAGIGTVTDNGGIYYTSNGSGSVVGRFSAGDAFPSTAGANTVYAVSPIYTIP